jgi:hypothetical protein
MTGKASKKHALDFSVGIRRVNPGSFVLLKRRK